MSLTKKVGPSIGAAPGAAPNDPYEQHRREDAQNTFRALALLWQAKVDASRSAATQEKVLAWLEHDVFPCIGSIPVSAIKPRDVLGMVQRIEARGAVDSAHCIRAYNGHIVAVSALKLTPLVFVRPGELRAAVWREFDLDGVAWRIPAAKMKMRMEHMVPLSTQALEILRQLRRVTDHGKYVFPSLRTEQACMSENTVNAALRGMGFAKEVMTAHGFHATARTIMDEVLGERVDLIEHQLAHRVIDHNPYSHFVLNGILLCEAGWPERQQCSKLARLVADRHWHGGR